MRCVVSGVAGFIGSQLSEALLAAGADVVGLDSFTPYYERDRKERNLHRSRDYHSFELHELDLRVADLVPVVEGADAVLHLAGQPGVRSSWGADFADYVGHNIIATQRLLEAAKDAAVGRFVLASSSSVYGNAVSYPTRESDLPLPFSPYGVTKLAAEQLCGVYTANWDLPTISLRYFTVYGPRQRPDMGLHRFIEATVEGRPIHVYGTGKQRRDFTHVSDVVTATRLAAERPTPPGTVVNVAGGSNATVTEVLEHVGELVQKKPVVETAPQEPGDVDETRADCARARDLLGWTPCTSLEDGLASQVEWHLALRGGGRRA